MTLFLDCWLRARWTSKCFGRSLNLQFNNITAVFLEEFFCLVIVNKLHSSFFWFLTHEYWLSKELFSVLDASSDCIWPCAECDLSLEDIVNYCTSLITKCVIGQNNFVWTAIIDDQEKWPDIYIMIHNSKINGLC